MKIDSISALFVKMRSAVVLCLHMTILQQMSQTNPMSIESQISWMRQPANYQAMTPHQLQEENRRVLQTLKMLEGRLDKQLQQQKKAILQSTSHPQTDQIKLAEQNIKNSQNYLKVIEKEAAKLRARKQQLIDGLQSRLNTRKYELEKRTAELKTQIRKLKLQENEFNKRLGNRTDLIQPEGFTEHIRLEEQLRVFSLKYMKLLEKHNKVSEQLALSGQSGAPELHIPEEIYDRELEEREEAQFQEYQGIVKLSNILARRNESQNTKLGRIYAGKLKDLERAILNLGQIDRQIALREGEIIQGRKNLQLVQFKVASNEKVDDQLLTMSHSSLRRNSYSTSRLPLENKHIRDKQFSQKSVISRKLSKL